MNFDVDFGSFTHINTVLNSLMSYLSKQWTSLLNIKTIISNKQMFHVENMITCWYEYRCIRLIYLLVWYPRWRYQHPIWKVVMITVFQDHRRHQLQELIHLSNSAPGSQQFCNTNPAKIRWEKTVKFTKFIILIIKCFVGKKR